MNKISAERIVPTTFSYRNILDGADEWATLWDEQQKYGQWAQKEVCLCKYFYLIGRYCQYAHFKCLDIAMEKTEDLLDDMFYYHDRNKSIQNDRQPS